MKAALDLRGICDPDEIELFLRVVPAMDGEWLDHHYNEADTKRRATTDKRKRGQR